VTPPSRVNRLARRDVDDCGTHLEPGVAGDFLGRVDIILAQIGQKDVLAPAA
jgi:hypothetical protein